MVIGSVLDRLGLDSDNALASRIPPTRINQSTGDQRLRKIHDMTITL